MFKNNIIIFTGLLVFIMAGVSFAEKQKESSSDVCGGSPLIQFRMNDSDHTEFLIPEAYLDDEYNFYHKVKSPISLIQLIAKSSDLSPDCERVAWNRTIATNSYRLQNFVSIAIHNYRYDDLTSMKESHQTSFPYFVEEKNGYKIYRSKQYEKNKNIIGEMDFMEPADSKIAGKFFAVCSRGLHEEVLVSCLINQHVQKNLFIEYIIKPDDVYQMEKWVNDTDHLIQNFIVRSAQNGGQP